MNDPDVAKTRRPAHRVLIVGATGTMGGHVLSEVSARRAAGTTVRVLVRARRPELPEDVDQVVGDLGDPGSVRAALADVDAVFLMSPHDAEEIAFARSFVSTARELGVRVVFAGVHIPGRRLRGRLQRRVMSRFLPHYRGKLEIGRLVEQESPGAVILVPSYLFENDDLFLDEFARGRYPLPMRGMPRVATADVGAIAAAALLDPAFPSGSHVLHGTPSMTGEDCARIWAAALDRPVEYTGGDAQAWARVADQHLPVGRKGIDFRATYAALGRVAVRTDPGALRATAALLGRPPRSYDDWVDDRARTMAAREHGSVVLDAHSQPASDSAIPRAR